MLKNEYENKDDSEFRCDCGELLCTGILRPDMEPFNKPIFLLCNNCNAVYRVNEHKSITIDKADEDEAEAIRGRAYLGNQYDPHVPVASNIRGKNFSAIYPQVRDRLQTVLDAQQEES